MPLQIDNRTYFTIENADRTLQNQLTTVVAVISTVTNFLLFYLILKHSKKEKTISRVVNFLQNLFLYLSQLHWGSFFGLVYLLPFPAVYSIGVLSNVLSSFWLVTIWIFLFCLFAVMMFLVILIRLKSITKPNTFLDLKNSTYVFIVISVLIFAFVPISYVWFPSNRPVEEMKEYVTRFYPNCRKALDIPGIFIYVDSSQLNMVNFTGASILIIGGFTYTFFCVAIIYEIRQQSRSMSARHLRYHIKVLKDIAVQNVFRFFFLVIPPILLFKNAYVPPEIDTITPSILANVVFSAAPIPCTILMYVQNESYRQFFRRKLMFWKEKRKIENQVFERSSLATVRATPVF